MKEGWKRQNLYAVTQLFRGFPHNYKHHISSHLISLPCVTAFLSVLPGTKSRAVPGKKKTGQP